MTQETQSNSSEIPLLTFNSLYNILREEKRSKSLQKMPELFYEALNNFFENKEAEVRNLKEDKEKLKKERFVISNSKKITKELLNLRCMKIANVGIKNEIFGEEILTKDNILKNEEEFLSELAKSVLKMKNKVINR